MRNALVFLGALVCSLGCSVGWADTIHYTASLHDTPVGESTYTIDAQGKFSSVTKLVMGGANVETSVSGVYADGKVKNYHAATDSAQGKVVVDFDGVKLKVEANGAKREASPIGWLPMGNMHPSFIGWLLKTIKYEEKKDHTVQALLLDLGAVIPAVIRPELEKGITVDGQQLVAKIYTARFSGTEVQYAVDSKGNVVGMDVPMQRFRFVADGWKSLYVDPMAAFPELSQPTHTLFVQRGVTTNTHDGVQLVSDIYRPAELGRYPVILVRTPYGRVSESLNAQFYVSRGYAYVVQDCRGRGDSHGEWDPFVHEGQDGTDTIFWLVALPWCDGNIGMIGGSYGGYVQWATAVSTPRALKCIVPQVSPPDAMHNIPYDFGVFALHADLWWSRIVADRKMDVRGLAKGFPHPEALSSLPLLGIDERTLGQKAPFFEKWLDRETLGDWKGFDYQSLLDRVTIPVLHISGWWDGDEPGTMLNYGALKNLGRDNQWLIYGPWTHAFNTTTSIGDQDYGKGAILELDSLYLRWFDTWLKGKDVGLASVPKVRAFVTGANKWVDMAGWPDDGSSKARKFFLSDVGGATVRTGKGVLDFKPPSKQAPSSYIYDPAKDVVPAAMLSGSPAHATFVEDFAGSEDSTLLYTSEPFAKVTAIAGPYDVRLFFSSNAQDTDFFVFLYDVDEAGKAHVIAQPGKLRASYREGYDARRPLEKDKVYDIHIRPWDSAHEFAKGHRMAIAISSSGFPLYARNLGTMEPIKTGTQVVVQTNKILHDQAHPSSIGFRVLWEH